MNACQRSQVWASGIEAGGGLDHLRIALRRQSLFLQGRRQNSHTQRFAQDQHIARLGRGIALDATRVRQAQHHQAVNWLYRVNAVATRDGYACVLTHALPTRQNAPNHLGTEHIDGHTHQGQSEDGCAAHGIDIADRVGGGDATKVKRVVDDGHEEVGGGNQGLLVIELVHRRVVCRVYAHQQLRRQRKAAHATQNIAQHARGDLATAAPAMGQRSQTRRVVCRRNHRVNLPCDPTSL